MKLTLDDGDLKPEHKMANASTITFEMFTDVVQAAIIAVGQALWEGNQTHQAVYPPK